MPSEPSRREFIAGLGMLATSASLSAAGFASSPKSGSTRIGKSPFKIAVITDEISPDFAHACEVASQQFGMQWVEIRTLWKKNVIDLDAKEIAEAVDILKKQNLRVTDIASPLFKVDWPGAPKSKFSPKHDAFNSNLTYDQQDEVLTRCMELARKFSTDRIRCFDFWRLDDPAPYRKAINEVLRNAAGKAAKSKLILVLENEFECNTATGAEAAQTMAAIPSQNFMLNWDPGNAARLGEIAYPDGYKLLPKGRIGHCHVKDVAKTEKGSDWAAMGKGIIDWAGQFAALKHDGYRQAVSLETHWHGAGTSEASSVECWVGMKEALERAKAL
jgi:L-ribulose-5-phosphate 3-epimerase